LIIEICNKYPGEYTPISRGEIRFQIVCAYIYENDSLLKFNVLKYELYGTISEGNIERYHMSSGPFLSSHMKSILSSIDIEGLSEYYLQNVYVQDINGNVLLFKEKRNLYDIYYGDKNNE
jgi:hypothetical protein